MKTWTRAVSVTFALLALVGLGACGPTEEDADPTCIDGVRNGDETDVDCGGACPACLDAKACARDADCVSGLCESGSCLQPPTCIDRSKNGDETDVDCGGSCSPCAAGKACGAGADCASGICDVAVCLAAPSCTDGTKNGDESDVDCGGSCAGCAIGAACSAGGDCASGSCDGGVCKAEPTCTDGLENGDESDVDCGGSCGPCADGKTCGADGDCASGRCDGGVCTAEPTCTDGLKNGDESDIDCGGSCPGCPDGRTCNADEDCTNGLCTGGLCDPGVEPCSNGVRDGDETDVDCGGSCEKCQDGYACLTADDCAGPPPPSIGWPICEDGLCGGLLVCIDYETNGLETDVDCGGPFCKGCMGGLACNVDTDCFSGGCNGGTCTDPDTGTCADGVKDGQETDVDCGGPCDPCPDGFFCAFHADCEYEECVDGACSPDYACTDAEIDGHETDVDCGGGVCQPCRAGKACVEDADCGSGTCTDEACVGFAPTCTDEALDGTETDVDCGGPGCAPCEVGKSCSLDEDCTSGFCNAGTCEMDLTAMQSSAGSVSCSSSGVVPVMTGLTITGLVVASPAFPLDATTDGYYVQQMPYTWPSYADPSFTGVVVWVDRSITDALGGPLAAGDSVTLVGDWEERDCETVFRVPASSGSITKSWPMAPAVAVVPAATFANGGGADAEPYEGVVVQLNGLTVTDDAGFDGTEGPGSPHWWFKATDGIYVANDFGLTLTVSAGQTLTSLKGAVKYSHGVYEIVPRSEDDVAVAP